MEHARVEDVNEDETKTAELNTEVTVQDNCPSKDIKVDQASSNEELSNRMAEHTSPSVVNVLGQQEINIHQVTTRYTFQFKSEMLQYYYSPGPDGYTDGNPILMGSPMFDGGWNTKWQISLTINRWIDMERWISLFITRLDDEDQPVNMHCEFRVMNTDLNTVFHSMKSVIEPSTKNTTCGFTQFLVFSNALKVLHHDNSLCIDIHLTLMSSNLRIPQNPSPLAESEKNDDICDDNSMDETIVDPDDITEELPVYDDIEPEDLLAIHLQNEPVTFVSRTKLYKKSLAYQEHVITENESGCTNIINLAPLLQCERQYKRKIILEFAKFVQDDCCKILEMGCFSDLNALLELGRIMDMDSLITQCLTAMSLNLTPDDAVTMFLACRIYAKYVDENTEHCIRNIKEISKSAGFKMTAKHHATAFTCFFLDPKAMSE